jgi:hypothetical protein
MQKRDILLTSGSTAIMQLSTVRPIALLMGVRKYITDIGDFMLHMPSGKISPRGWAIALSTLHPLSLKPE